MVFDTSIIKPVDLSHKVYPLKDPVSPDDITRAVGEEGMLWPIFEYGSYVDDSIAQVIKMKTHLKTHIETPWHLNHVGRCLSEYAPETFYGRCVRLFFDVAPGTIITREMTEKADNGKIRNGDIVIAHTSVNENLLSSVYKSEVPMPQMSMGFAEYLVDKGIKLLGFDNSMECGYFMESREGKRDRAHDLLLRSDIPLLEMITNLKSLTQDVFFLMAIPGLMKIQGIDASPAQVVALEGFEVI